jgi:hypothetical protein
MNDLEDRMANFGFVMKDVFSVEHTSKFNELHFNKKEHSYTYFGVYPYTKLKLHHRIDDALKATSSIREASELLHKDEELYKNVLDFYWVNFWLPMQLHKVDSNHKAAEIMCFIINVGLGRKTKVVKKIQRLVGTVPDGIFGIKTITALNKYDDDKFDKEFDAFEIQFYNELVVANPKLKWALNGWHNRARLI